MPDQVPSYLLFGPSYLLFGLNFFQLLRSLLNINIKQTTFLANDNFLSQHAKGERLIMKKSVGHFAVFTDSSMFDHASIT